MPLAHAGHWLVSLLYLAPVAVLVVILVVTAVKERRRGAEEPSEPSDAPLR